MSNSSPQNNMDSSVLDALEADLPTIPASTVLTSFGALRAIQYQQDLEVHGSAASIVTVCPAAVRRLQVPVASMSDGSKVGSSDAEPIPV